MAFGVTDLVDDSAHLWHRLINVNINSLSITNDGNLQ
jgi:hypothetical protein